MVHAVAAVGEETGCVPGPFVNSEPFPGLLRR